MPNSSRAAGQLLIYKKYSEMARQALNSEQCAVYQCLAREALRQAAKLDPAAVARASASIWRKVGKPRMVPFNLMTCI
jgi:hypothetical protein